MRHNLGFFVFIRMKDHILTKNQTRDITPTTIIGSLFIDIFN